jgi:hypothetical protein
MSFSLLRLLELSGRLKLAEALTPQQAAAVFTAHGADAERMGDPSYLKQFRLSVNKANHPDAGGDGNAAAEVNAAYDVIKAGFSGSITNGDSAPSGADMAQGGRDWMRSKMAGDRPPAPKRTWPTGDRARRNDHTVTHLYVYTAPAETKGLPGGASKRQAPPIEHLDDVTGTMETLQGMIEGFVHNGDLQKSDVILAVEQGWSSVEVLYVGGHFEKYPQVIARKSDAPLDQDVAFLAAFPAWLAAIHRYVSWHSVDR